MSKMDDDLITYEVEIAEVTNIPCDLKKEDDSEQQMSYESDDDMEYDPSDARGYDEVELTDEESYDSEDEDEVAKFFRIETNIYLLKILRDLRLTKIIRMIGFTNETKMCHGWRDDGYCNRGNLPGAYIVGNALRYQDFEWYEALKDGKLKEEALKNKAIMEGIIEDEDNESKREYEMEHEDKEIREMFNDHEPPVCNIRRFEMIKFSFGQDEEYVAVKENEYDDLTSTSEDACRTYQEIFRMMDEG
ncbi:hypothetical protein Tco_1427126 [Tanacetum coccineum]